MRDQINQEALFSDETGYYRSPSEPRRGDPVTIKFRTAYENVDTVTLICGSFRQKMKRSYIIMSVSGRYWMSRSTIFLKFCQGNRNFILTNWESRIIRRKHILFA